PNVPQTFGIAKATLTVTASSGSMTYGGTVPTITASYSGFVNNDTTSVLSGQPSCSTLATSSSAVGSYSSSCTVGTLAAGNYSFSFVNGSVTVNKATTTTSVSLTSGTNPSTYGQSL